MNIRKTAASILRSAIRTRFRLVVLLTAVVIAGVGAGFTRAAQPPTIPALPGVPQQSSGYNLHATFKVTYSVDWSSQSGDKKQPCSSWRASEGLIVVEAHSQVPIQGHIQGIATGRRGGRQSRAWAKLSVVGKSEGRVNRTLVESGGFTEPAVGCGYPKPPPFVPPSNDCGKRIFASNDAALTATRREKFSMLTSSSRFDPQGFDRLDFTIAGNITTRLYQSCGVPPWALEYPTKNVGILVDRADRVALSKLKAGKSYKIQHDGGSRCTDYLPEQDDCDAHWNLDVTIRRDA